VAPGLSCAAIDAALRRAEAAGVELQPLSMYDVGSPRRAGVVLGYGAIPAEHVEEGLTVLRRCFDS
jgi:GntR family transcriptional regulator/MocR family aminotransferase